MPTGPKRSARRPRPISLPPVPPVEDLLAQERQARADACQQQINAALKRHHCRLQAVVTIADQQTQSRVVLVALPKT